MGLHNDPILLNKAVSASYATFASTSAFLLLNYSSWPIPNPQETSTTTTTSPNTNDSPPKKLQPDGNLDDSHNPLIAGKSRLANLLTLCETLYLVYDTYSTVHLTRNQSPKGPKSTATTTKTTPSSSRSSSSFPSALKAAARTSPATLAHHVLLASAFLLLQLYIAAGKEKGMYIITSFLLMNASTPFLHVRHFLRSRGCSKSTSDLLNALFLAVFAASRFGAPVWVLRRYGAYHGLGVGEVWSRMRAVCRVGTGALVGGNAVWWGVMVGRVVGRGFKRRVR